MNVFNDAGLLALVTHGVGGGLWRRCWVVGTPWQIAVFYVPLFITCTVCPRTPSTSPTEVRRGGRMERGVRGGEGECLVSLLALEC